MRTVLVCIGEANLVTYLRKQHADDEDVAHEEMAAVTDQIC